MSRISTHKICTAHNIAVRMNQWRVAAQRIKGIRNRRQFCVVHFHQRRDLVQLFLFISSDHSQHVSNVAGNVTLSHHHVPVLLDVANLVAGDIRLCQDFYAVRMCSGTGDINTIDVGAGVTGIIS